MTAGDAPAADLAVYVHWPFCPSKCPYCDFNSHVREAVPEAEWRDALLKDLAHTVALTGKRRVTSVFFGGGTPSLMLAETAGAVIDAIAGHWHLDPGAEITLEANPGSADAGRFHDYRRAGVNRLSVGVQSLDDRALRFLGREHDAAAARRAVAAASAAVDRFSFDLIYARPGQSLADWQQELDEAMAMAGGHLSVYQLTIEPGTAFHTAHRLGDLDMPDEDLTADLYEATVERLGAAGLPAYEISNHARPGEESRHNLAYWRYDDYVGVGPGAHGRVTRPDGERLATRQVRLPEAWAAAVAADGHGQEEASPIEPADATVEALMMGLRLAEGVDLARLERRTGRSIAGLLDFDRLEDLGAEGLVERKGARLRATAAGRQRLNAVLAALLA